MKLISQEPTTWIVVYTCLPQYSLHFTHIYLNERYLRGACLTESYLTDAFIKEEYLTEDQHEELYFTDSYLKEQNLTDD